MKLRDSPALRSFEEASRKVSDGSASPENDIDDAIKALIEYRKEVDFKIFEALAMSEGSGTEVTETHAFVTGKELKEFGKFVVKSAPGWAMGPFAPIADFVRFGYERWQTWHRKDPISKAHQDESNQQKRRQAELEVETEKLLRESNRIIRAEHQFESTGRDLCSSVQ
jgi:hypothetical protein